MKLLVIALAWLIACFGALGYPNAHFNDKDAVKAIAGECAGEPYQAKLWVACIIRNRGSLRGVYGANKPKSWLDRQPGKVKTDCQRAWAESAKGDVTGGCLYFGGTIDDAYFFHTLHLQPVRTIGHTRFYK